MKKIFGLLGAMVFAVVLFANTDSMNTDNELNLADLASLNTADAECVTWMYNNGYCTFTNRCSPDATAQGNGTCSTLGGW